MRLLLEVVPATRRSSWLFPILPLIWDSFGTLVLQALPLGSAEAYYELLVNGYSKGQLLFSNHTSLSFASKSFSVFIQTDKATYKPGQDVKIRVVTLHPDLTPYSTPVNIYIQDPQRNLIQQWLTQNGKLGKIAKQFKLSKYPLLGVWSVEVQVNNQAYYQSFTVEIWYTYGKPMKGKVTIDFFTLFRAQKTKITKILEINGSLNFTLESPEIKDINFRDEGMLCPAPIEIIAVVTESVTGTSQNASATVFPQLYDYVVDFLEYPRFLKPSLNFIGMLKVRRTDDNPLTSDEQKNNVMIMVRQPKTAYHMYDDEDELQKNNTVHKLSYPVPENGVIQVEFPVSADTTILHIKAKFLESQTSKTIHDVFYSASLTYLQIKKTKDLKVGTPLELTVQSSMPLNEINYMVMSRGQIVDAGKKKTTMLNLTPENSWAPMACIIAFYVHDNGEIINDVLHIPVQPTFKNQINMHWSKNRAGPAEDITLKIKMTEPQTTIGLLVVDKSTNLLGKRNDITEDAIYHELSLYDTKSSDGKAGNAFSVFQNSNLWILTDANLSEHVDYFDMIVYSDMDYDLDSLSISYKYNPTLYDGDPYVRTNFPETWLWQEIMTRSTETTTNVTVPDTITSWVTSAFIVSENLGLGVMKIPFELEVFQPFFVSLNLPASVIRGEQFILEVNIFNYLKESTEVTVTLDTSDTFEILIFSNDINAIGNQQSVWTPSEDGKTVFFPVKPKQIGEIPIRVTATSSIASDALLQRLLVKAEGLEQCYSETVLLDLTKRTNLTETLNFNFPSDVVPGSERVQVTVTGDKLSSSISGLESLVKMPYGCGEQNMINFAPNIYILDYLSKTGNLQTNFKSKVVSYMREGYQRELLYKRPDGSFSAFGKSDPSGSTWLSAFVLSFIQAQPYIDIDPYILERTAAWILSHQKSSGEFEGPGRVLHTELQEGTSGSVSCTAYILTAQLEYQFRELRLWTSPSSGLSSSWQPHSADIEVASYALLSHFIQQRLLEGIPVMKWLSKQRNHLGGYSSTQFPATQPVRVTISANGHGFAIFQLNAIYNVKSSHTSKRRRSAQNQEAFDLNVYVKDDKEDINSLILNVCTRYLGTGSSSRSGMALIEIGLLSGFSLSPSFVSLDDPVKKVEKDEGKIHLYLDSLNETQVCVDIPAVRDFKVSNTQDASVTVMDYYEPRRRAVKSYNSLVMQSLSSCTFCEDNECNLCKTDGSSPVSLF